MYTATTLQFLKDLKENNNKPWFEANRKAYDAARNEHLEVVAGLIKAIGEWDEAVAQLEPKQCIFRINRDVRFSKDKSPYKTNFGAYFSADRKEWKRAGYYFHLSPEGSFLAGGVYSPGPEHLRLIRQEIDYNLSEFESILSSPDFKKHWGGTLEGEKLKKAPKDYPADHPGIEYLKQKDFIVKHEMGEKELYSPDFIKKAASSFRSLYTLNRFLDRVWE